MSTLLIQFYGWTGFDPIASLFIAILIAASVIPLVLDTGRILSLDVGDQDVLIHRAISEVCTICLISLGAHHPVQLSSINGLASFSGPRFWPKDSSSLIGSIHIQLAPSESDSSQKAVNGNLDQVVERVDTLLRKNIPGLEELTIQVEEQR